MHAPAAELDEEEDIQPLQRDRLDGEEVDRKHALGLGPEKGTPRQTGAHIGRAKSRLPQYPPNRRRGDDDAEAIQLTHDPLVAPARVLARQP
jgi:hypothetical protein